MKPALFSIKTITLSLFLTASVNMGWQVYRMHEQSVERQRDYEQYGVIACKFGLSRDESSRMHLELLPFTAMIGVFVRGLKHTLLSVFGLTGAATTYLFWWRYFFSLRELSGADLSYMPQTAYLLGGNYLDIAIGLIIVWLIGWHVSRAVGCFRSTEPIV